METPPQVGKNIAKFRNSKNLTLNILSERSGVSKAMLSQIESNKVNPTIATVWKISRGLGVELQELIDVDSQPKRTFSVNPSEKEGASIEATENGAKIKILSPIDMVEDMEMYLLTLEPHTSLRSDPHYEGTQEFLTIIKGGVRVVAGDNEADLKKGDFIIYHCDVEHTIFNNTNQSAIVHMVVRYTPHEH